MRERGRPEKAFSGFGRNPLSAGGAGFAEMAQVAEIESRFVGMFFLLRRVVRRAKEGYEYTVPGGGAMARRSRDRKVLVL